ncbi:MAG: 2-amino-4-hydroxy-6-hydroxymethyldihydropteridine diphosphokinase [Bacteroidales bacterium]|jgi:2-amino-4-hydroxy-6-hydroxymethyldihydropteridine diphosphokinase|nr:2-amino-4-hydroxy-6-hydroxymethyldihydropteridine diphosphokinase [Bacteroidales bacterium]
MMERIFLILGSNMGERETFLRRSIALLDTVPNRVLRTSSVYESDPWGFEHPTGRFLNQAVELQSPFTPFGLLERIHAVEEALGRVRVSGAYSARTIDIDILFFGDRIVRSRQLEIPHRRMTERMFVLQPLSELIPDFIHPVFRLTVKELKDRCTDPLPVRQYG